METKHVPFRWVGRVEEGFEDFGLLPAIECLNAQQVGVVVHLMVPRARGAGRVFCIEVWGRGVVSGGDVVCCAFLDRAIVGEGLVRAVAVGTSDGYVLASAEVSASCRGGALTVLGGMVARAASALELRWVFENGTCLCEVTKGLAMEALHGGRDILSGWTD